MQTISSLVEHCAQETDRFFRGQRYDSQSCFELFKRAILERDQPAWEAVYTQYNLLVSRWVQQHPGFEASGEEAPYFVNCAFEKIWVALTPDKFKQFTELASLLKYLKMCVHSVIADHHRSLEQAELVVYAEEAALEKTEAVEASEDWMLSQIDRQKFWEAINARLNDDKERRVVYGSFILALKPRELYEQYSRFFDSVDEVYEIKQNLLARMRRDPDFYKYLSGYA